MLSGKPRLMKTQGQSLLDPWAIFALPICSLDARSNNQAGRGQSQAWFPCSPQPASWVNRKDLVTRPLLCPPGWSLHPSIPLSSLTRRPLHQARHHAFQQLCRQSPTECELTTQQQKCNPNNWDHSELMRGFTYQINKISGKCRSLL